jgi:hypothetical protein
VVLLTVNSASLWLGNLPSLTFGERTRETVLAFRSGPREAEGFRWLSLSCRGACDRSTRVLGLKARGFANAPRPALAP